MLLLEPFCEQNRSVDDAAHGCFSPRRTFTFIAPTGFDHPATCTHVRLLGPCFKTGRMRPYDRRHFRRVMCEHRTVDRRLFVRTGVPSATVDTPSRQFELPGIDAHVAEETVGNGPGVHEA